MSREAGVEYEDGNASDRKLGPEFGRLVEAHRKQRKLSVKRLCRLVQDEMQRLGHDDDFYSEQYYRIRRGTAGAFRLQVWTIAAFCQALEITDPLHKARMYEAAGHIPPDSDLTRYARQWEDEEPARAS